MKGLIWVVALFALAVGVSLAMSYNEGYVLLVLPPYRAEISLNLALIAQLAAFVVFYGLVRAVLLARSLPRRAREYRERKVLKMNEAGEAKEVKNETVGGGLSS